MKVYVLEGVWAEGRPPELPRDARAARAAAEGFLRRLARRLELLRPDLPEELRGVTFVPWAKAMATVLVPRAAGDGWEHWLYRAQAAPFGRPRASDPRRRRAA